MRIVLMPGHATERLQERGYTKSDVESVLRAPIQSRPGRGGAIVFLDYDTRGKLAEVAALRRPNDTYIIKTMFPKETR